MAINVDSTVETSEYTQLLIMEEKAAIFDELFRNGSASKTENLIELEAKLEKIKRRQQKGKGLAGASGSASRLFSAESFKKIREKREGVKKVGRVEKLFQIEHDDPSVYTILPGEPDDTFGFEDVSPDFDPTLLDGEQDQLAQLPRSIKVVTWAGSRNLFQALILGPNNTVYEDGLFLFAIFIPNNYPQELPKVRYFFSNVGIGGELVGGMLKETFVEKLWKINHSITGILTGIQSENGFFENEEGSRTHCRRIWASINEILRFSPPHFKNQIKSHFLARLPYLEAQKEIDLRQKKLTQGEKDIVEFHWTLLCTNVLGKEDGDNGEGSKPSIKKWFKCMCLS